MALPPAPRPAGPTAGLTAIVDALLGVRAMQDDYQRRAIIAALPEKIRTAVPDNTVGRLHVIGIVRTCQDYPDGQEALLDALGLALGAESPEWRRTEAAIRAHWPPARQ
jgi:hypothetical protein